MDNEEYYKLFQISSYLYANHGFRQFSLKQYNEFVSQEAWLFNLENPNYQLIRISFYHLPMSANEQARVDYYVNYFKKSPKVKGDFKFLDIHLNTDEYDKNLEEYDYLNVEENYSAGVDVSTIFPEVYGSVHHVDDVDKEIKVVAKRMGKTFKEKKKQLPFFEKYPTIFTLIIIGICCGMFFVVNALKHYYDEAAVLLLCGADYKMLTLGCQEYYRLITYAFVHSDFAHLFCNMVSLYSIGSYVEKNLGHGKFLIILFVSILCGSLTQGILTDNDLCIGMSGGIYGLFIAFIIETLRSRIIVFKTLIPTIILNIMLNFLSNTAWMAHLGGLIGGLAVYYALNKKKNYPGIALVVLLIAGLLFKFLSIDHINTIYGGTDNAYLNLLNSVGLNADKLLLKLLQAYKKFGG